MLARGVVSASEWFKNWSNFDIDEIFTKSELREYAKDDLVYRDFEHPEMILIVTGSVWACLINGRTVAKFGLMYPSSLVGVAQMLTATNITKAEEVFYEYKAAEDSLALAIPTVVFMSRLEQKPLLWRATAEAVINYQRSSLKINLLLNSGPIKNRLILAVYQLAASGRLGQGILRKTELSISQEELALLIQSTRPYVNRALRELASEGLIRLGYKHLEVIDFGALEQIVARSVAPPD